MKFAIQSEYFKPEQKSLLDDEMKANWRPWPRRSMRCGRRKHRTVLKREGAQARAAGSTPRGAKSAMNPLRPFAAAIRALALAQHSVLAKLLNRCRIAGAPREATSPNSSSQPARQADIEEYQRAAANILTQNRCAARNASTQSRRKGPIRFTSKLCAA